MDFTAFEAGLRVTPVAGGLILGGPLSAKLAARFGTRNVVAIGLGVVALALFLLAGADAQSGYGLVAGSLVIMGFGMGMTMAPATESIMTALPAARAGVGSAMNDTVRMVGGTLGVAVLGSLLSSGYGADMEKATAALPEGASRAAEESLGGASQVAAQMGGGAGETLSRTAETAFSSAMSVSLTVGAAVALAGALVALFVLPGQQRERAETPWPRPSRLRAARSPPSRRPREQRRQEPEVLEAARPRGRPRSAEAHQAISRGDPEAARRARLRGAIDRGGRGRGGRGQDDHLPALGEQGRACCGRDRAATPAPGTVPDTGTFVGDLDALSKAQRARLGGTPVPRIIPRLLADTADDEALHALVLERAVGPIRAIVRAIVDKAVERGELRDDLDREAIVDVFHAIPVYKILMTGGDLDASAPLPAKYGPMLLEGLAPRRKGQ